MLRFDHIAFTAPTRDTGRAAFAAATGVHLPDGGNHPAMGTHNAVAALGPDQFVEVIAIDPDGTAPARARWFGLDDRPDQPDLGPAIVLYRTDDIDRDLDRAARLGLHLGTPVSLSRGGLTWLFALVDDGHPPHEGGAPILLQWTNDGPHPASAMSDPGLRLSRLAMTTPLADEVSAFLADADLVPDIELGDTPAVKVTFRCPDGREAAL